MIRFVGRRIVYIALIYVLIVFFVHMGMRMMRNSDASRPDYDLVRYGQLAWQDTRASFSRALRGDLGQVHTSRGMVPVTEIVGEAYWNSMGLLLVALTGATVGGLCFGFVAALTRDKTLSLSLLLVTLLGISTPAFFLGLLLQLGELQYLATFGRRLVSIAGFGWDLHHMLLPVLVLAARPLAYLTRTTFLSLGQVMQEDYIRTAFAKGVSSPRAVRVHAIRNVAVPVLTAIGVAVRFSLGALPVVEFFFAWPGMGRRLLEAIDARHVSVVVALASALGLTLLLVNLLLDVAYRIVDPRVRSQPELSGNL